MPARPALPDVLRLGRAIRRGSAIDEPISLVSVVREFVSGDTPDDSPLTLKTLMGREDYRDLSTPKLAVGDAAFDFELPRYDFSEGTPLMRQDEVVMCLFEGQLEAIREAAECAQTYERILKTARSPWPLQDAAGTGP